MSSNNKKMTNILFSDCFFQWMGNLVTNDWWGDAWLHEGMATYYQNDLYDVVENTWDRVGRQLPNTVFLLGQRSEPRFASLLL